MQDIFKRNIVITPCKNEAMNLPNLVHSMEAQTNKPSLWVIVDDGSTDETASTIKTAEKQYNWIKGVYLPEHNEYMGSHYAQVCNKAFAFAEEYCQKNNVSYKYIALVDADNILEREYFEKLINEFENDPNLGIASGNNAYADVEKLMDGLRTENANASVMDRELWQMYGSSFMLIQNGREDVPMGSARMWRKECFEETGGYLHVSAPDAVSNVKAKLRGWKTKRFISARVIERQASVKHGAWKGYNEMGKRFFFLWYPVSLALLKSIKFSIKKPYYPGIAFFCGYIKSLIYGEKRIDDVEIKQYYQKIRPQELKDHYKGSVKKW